MADNGDHDMQISRPSFSWNFNLGTMLAILLAVISGIYWLSKLEAGQESNATAMDALRLSISDLRARTEPLQDNPIRIRALEEQQKATNARLDRLADTIINGQELMRRDFSAAVEVLRKDINDVSTKVEVLGSKLDDQSRPQRTGFKP